MAVVNAPLDYHELLDLGDVAISFRDVRRKGLDAAHIFTKQRAELEERLPKIMRTVKQDGMIWISWPKRAAKIETDITEDVVRAVALPLGLVDVKVCAVNDVWSGLKLVLRKENKSL